MELLIPIVALGSLYMSTKSSTDTSSSSASSTSSASTGSSSRKSVEGFTKGPIVTPVFNKIDAENRRLPRGDDGNSRYIGQSPITAQYPSQTFAELDKTVIDNAGIYDYPNQTVATNTYLNQTMYESQQRSGKNTGNALPEVYSLSGNVMAGEDFRHHNMVPFIGSKIAGPLYDNKYAENILDNMNGTGSQLIKKVEQPPLFDPSDNVQYAYGTPNASDFYQSRVNPGMVRNNTKPWESINVGPGLDSGYTSAGVGGFNSGMDHRDRWMPKTVDELRVDTNPKMEYSLNGHEGPLQSVVKDVGSIGEVDRKLPDSFFINSPDRWLTTTGAQKGETMRSEQPTGIIKRPEIDVNYTGPAGGHSDGPSPESKNNYEPCKRPPVKQNPILGARSHATNHPKTHQNRLDNYVSGSTNRQSSNPQDRIYGNAYSGVIGSIVAPIVDFLRPSRKEEIVNNIRVYGDPSSRVSGGIMHNPQDIPKITTKETTLYTPRAYINNQREGTYVNTQQELPINNRNLSNTSFTGCVGGQSTSYGETSFDSAYNQTCNNLKSQTIPNRINVGGMDLFNNNINMCLSKSDVTQQDYRTGPANSAIKMPPSTNTYGHVTLSSKINTSESDEKLSQSRLDPSMLKAFYNNPYTHSLSSVA
jgi:hypothetical protein